MAARQDIINQVRAFTEQILASGVPLDRVILFGSQALGNAHKESDVDVALVSRVFNGFGFEDRKHFSKINIQNAFMEIETKTFGTDYFEKGDPFITEILKTGIEIYRA